MPDTGNVESPDEITESEEEYQGRVPEWQDDEEINAQVGPAQQSDILGISNQNSQDITIEGGNIEKFGSSNPSFEQQNDHSGLTLSV